jgi:hypothetical protein
VNDRQRNRGEAADVSGSPADIARAALDALQWMSWCPGGYPGKVEQGWVRLVGELDEFQKKWPKGSAPFRRGEGVST